VRVSKPALIKALRPAHRASLFSSASLVCDPFPLVDCAPDASSSEVTERALREALKIADYLCETVHYVKSVPFSVGNSVTVNGVVSTTLLPPTLYDGVPGIGLFIAYCYKVTGHEHFLDYARRAHKLVRNLARSRDYLASCGAFSGYTGLIYVDLHLSKLLGSMPIIRDPTVKSRIQALLDQADLTFDVISGSAGVLIVLARWLLMERDTSVRRLARTAASALAKLRERDIWDRLVDRGRMLGGIAHGTAGVAWALAEWLQIEDSAEHRELLDIAFRHQISFERTFGKWIDARDGKLNSFWCHGAAGIGLAADRISKLLTVENSKAVVESTIEAVLDERNCESHCLCHGTLGNADLLLQAGRIEAARELARTVLDAATREGAWRFGLGSARISYGLMCGLAGIGFGLLRIAIPTQIPSVLTLDGPVG